MTWRTLKQDIGFAFGLLRRRPFSVLIQVTNRCNMRCDFCGFWNNAASPENELSLADLCRVEGQLAGLGRFLVSLEGGEPMLRPDIARIVKVFSARHIPLLYTNGWHVDPENARDLFTAGLSQAGVSIDFAAAARHDERRGPPGAFERAWRAVGLLRDAAPHGGKQVHVMTVLMEENLEDLEPLLEQSARAGVGHQFTLLSTRGFRRGHEGRLPAPPVSARLRELWRRHKHLRFFRRYFDYVDAHLTGGAMPACGAGRWGFNIDHLGDVSPCIERIHQVAGNVRQESLSAIYPRMAGLGRNAACQDCWTCCRATAQFCLSGRPTDLLDLSTRMRS